MRRQAPPSGPIGDYALLSDCRTAALVSRAGSVEWLCFPRFDGPSVFARLLDDEGGHFSVRVAGATASRRYLPGTMTLETTFRTAAGTAVLVDAMAVGRNERGHELGAGSPGALLRQLTCTEGTVEVEVEYAPRPEYGIVFPLLAQVDGGVMARGGADVLHLSCSHGLQIEGSNAVGRRMLRRRDHPLRAPVPPQLGRPGRGLAGRGHRPAARRHHRGLAHLVGPAPGLRGPMARPGPPLGLRAPGADLRADRGDRRRSHRLAP
jgi:hypothetical protein